MIGNEFRDNPEINDEESSCSSLSDKSNYDLLDEILSYEPPPEIRENSEIQVKNAADKKVSVKKDKPSAIDEYIKKVKIDRPTIQTQRVSFKTDNCQTPLTGFIFKRVPTRTLLPDSEGLVFKFGLGNSAIDYRTVDQYGFNLIPFSVRSFDDDTKNTRCCFCRTVFKARWELERHIIKHVNKKHKCSICGVTYSTRTFLKRHINAAHGKFRNMCSICGKVCSSQSFLVDHARVKHGHIRNKCVICARVLVDVESLTEHMEKLHCDMNYFL